MVANVVLHEALVNGAPTDGMLSYYKNCAAIAFARVLGIRVNPALNLFISKGWIKLATDLQHDKAIEKVVAGLPLTKVATDESWLSLKPRLSSLKNGRYFAVNTGANKFGGQGIGHAVAIIIKGGSWAMNANNAEKKNSPPYSNGIAGSAKFSVWGPA